MTRSSAGKRNPAGESLIRPWRVLHACERALDVASVTDAQLGVGMRPQVLAREFWSQAAASTATSLLTAWHAVRDWRHALNEAEALTSFQIVHAHSITSAMAAVRGSLPTVYDFRHTLEELNSGEGVTNSGPWMLRSFRVAEQFALSRASAVVTHSESMKEIVCCRGAARENAFVVPEPRTTTSLIPDSNWATLHGIDLGYHAVIVALPRPTGIEQVLRAFANIQVEIEQALLVFELGELDRANLLQMARDLDVADNIRVISAEERKMAIACSDVVLASSTGSALANSDMLEAMSCGKAVVAADVQENRECSPDGRGVNWYRDEDTQDLAHRAAFVARNKEFSRALGEAARVHISETRSPQVIGRLYDEVYRHAQSRRNDSNSKIELPRLYTANVTV